MNKNKLHLKNNKKFYYSLIENKFFDEEFFELLFEFAPESKNNFIFLYKSQMVLNYDAFVWFLNNLHIESFIFFSYHFPKLLNLNIDIKNTPTFKNANHIQYGFRANYFNLLNTLQTSYLQFLKSEQFLKYIHKDIKIISNLLFIYSTSDSLPLKFFSLYKTLLRVFCNIKISEKDLKTFTYSPSLHHALYIYLKYNKVKFSIQDIFTELCKEGKLKYLKSLDKHNIYYKSFFCAPLKMASIYNSDPLVAQYLIGKCSPSQFIILEIIDLLYLEKNKLYFNDKLADFFSHFLCVNDLNSVHKILNNNSYIKVFRVKLQYEQLKQDSNFSLSTDFSSLKIKNKI